MVRLWDTHLCRSELAVGEEREREKIGGTVDDASRLLSGTEGFEDWLIE